MIGKGTTMLGMGSTGHQEGWTECFQDLQTWCPPPQDELNTPQVTTECFNFGNIDQTQSKDLDVFYPVDLMPDTLGGDMAYFPTATYDIEEDNNNNTLPQLKQLQTTSTADFGIGGKLNSGFLAIGKSPLKSTSANVLLSQYATPGNPPSKKTSKVKPEMNYQTFTDGIPYDLAEDEENFLSVPPEQVIRRGKVPDQILIPKKERPKLKLEISPPAASSVVVMPSTPEVQNALNEPNVGFDLIKYVVSGDLASAGAVSGVNPDSLLRANASVVRDHNYVDSTAKPNPFESVFIKDEPLSPYPYTSTNPLTKNPVERSQGKRPVKRRRGSNSDYVFDSDICTSDDSADWEPSSMSTKKSRTKKAKPSKVDYCAADSDVESVASSLTTDKYRELRDKNNEASRRSRLNRKQRDVEMKKTADNLASENRALKARAERMQKLVQNMREIIMKTIKGSKT